MGESVSFSGPASAGMERRVVVVEQPDMYSAVLAPLMEEAEKVEKEGKVAVADRKGECKDWWVRLVSGCIDGWLNEKW